LNAGVKLLILTGAPILTGVEVGENNTGRKLVIYASGANVTIPNESAESLAVNRFGVGQDITVINGKYLEFIHISGRWRISQ
jgi:hypothetical protein